MPVEITRDQSWRAHSHKWGMPKDCKECQNDIGIYNPKCYGCRVRNIACGIKAYAIDMLKSIRQKEGPEAAEKMKRAMIEYRVAHGWMQRPELM